MKIVVISRDNSIDVLGMFDCLGELGHEVMKTTRDQAVLTCAVEMPDIVFCCGEVYKSSKQDDSLVLNDLQNSLSPKQKLIRFGFTTGGQYQLLRLPATREEIIASL
ncbi:MAG: hypothetical protein QG630_285 [Patescibacteria group bacterium]|nr:hypothetical protein [Patescibacteria group bacterium]